MDFNTWNMFWRLWFGLLATAIVAGNILIIWVFFKLRRRKRSSFLLIGLSVADLLVGALAIPLFIATYEASSRTIERVFTPVDTLLGTSSIYTLATISLERMFAIGWPFRHRTANSRVYMCAISLPWMIAAVFTVFLYAHLNFITTDSVIYRLVLVFILALPLLVICVAYFVIWRIQKSPICSNNNVTREAKLANTLFLITGASLLTWLPFQILILLVHLRVTTNFSHLQLTLFIIKVLQYSNSLVNVIIYPLRIPEFKNCLLHLLRCCTGPFEISYPGMSPSAESGSVVSLIRFTSGQFLSESSKQESAV